MQVYMSLAEKLINAITHGNIAGVQFKRSWSDEKATFDALVKVIDHHIVQEERVARENGSRELNIYRREYNRIKWILRQDWVANIKIEAIEKLIESINL